VIEQLKMIQKTPFILCIFEYKLLSGLVKPVRLEPFAFEIFKLISITATFVIKKLTDPFKNSTLAQQRYLHKAN
jgi:hypothetical protein